MAQPKREVPIPVRVAIELRNVASELQRNIIRADQAADLLDTLAHQLEKWIEASK
jgi:hypothetical protein